MTEIDYEALTWIVAQTYDSGWRRRQSLGGVSEDVARAVVAAYEQQLRDQGMVRVKEEDAYNTIYQALRRNSGMGWDSLSRVACAITAALVAAPERAEEDAS